MNKKTLIITGGSVDLHVARTICESNDFNYFIAADHGLVMYHQLGLIPHIVVGDFDSLDMNYLSYYQENGQTKILRYPAEKDMTDTEIAIEHSILVLSSEVMILGGTGNRVDHMLCNILLLKKYMDANIKCCILDKNNKIYLCDKYLQLYKKDCYGDYISFLPLSERVTDVTLRGFKYPLNKYLLMQGESIGVSNEIVEEYAEVMLSDGVLLVIEAKD